MKPIPRVTARRQIYKGRFIRLIREELEAAGHRMVRETVIHPGAAVVVPLLGRSRVVLVRQYRRAAGKRLLELPAGTLEPDEPPMSCARRELIEETGWRATRMRRLGGFYSAPGFTTEFMTIYIADGLVKTRANPEPDEHLEPVIMRFSQAVSAVRSGRITDGKSIIGLLLADAWLRRTR